MVENHWPRRGEGRDKPSPLCPKFPTYRNHEKQHDCRFKPQSFGVTCYVATDTLAFWPVVLGPSKDSDAPFSAACVTVRHLLHKPDSKLTIFGGFVIIRSISCTEVGISYKNHRTDTGRESGPETWDGILSVTSCDLSFHFGLCSHVPFPH